MKHRDEARTAEKGNTKQGTQSKGDEAQDTKKGNARVTEASLPYFLFRTPMQRHYLFITHLHTLVA